MYGSEGRVTREIRFSAAAGVVALLASTVGGLAHAAPAQMLAIVQHGFGGPEVLRLETIAVPDPGEGQVRVRVYAAGVNPSDYGMRTGEFLRMTAASSPPPTTVRPGNELAGIVDALGPGVTQFRVGEAVYAYVFGPAGIPGNGAYAEYTLVKADSLARKPKRLTFEEAAGAPTGAVTALRTLNTAGVHAGQTVVIVGAAGGVGSALVQLSKARGTRVVAIASSVHNTYLRQIGADEVANYDTEGGAALSRVRNADVVINTVPGQAADALAYVRSGGTLVSIAGAPPKDEQCAAVGASCPSGQRPPGPGALGIAQYLTEASRLIDEGKLSIHIQKTFPLSATAAAEEFNHAGHAEGKVVVIVSPKANER